MTFCRARALHVKAGQTKRAAHNKCTGSQPTPGLPWNQRPKVNENGRSHTERNNVGERVELNAKLTGGSGQTGRIAVQPVQNVGQNDENRRIQIVAVKSRNDEKKPADEIPRRK